MLHEICCDQFYQKQIVFNPGLSVVLGTNTGDNSIGKSTFLLIVDYVFGGSTYAGATDIIENVGPHDIYFSFVFGEKTFKFCRNSINANTVWKCNDSYEKVEEIGLSDYCKWLDSKYAISLPELSFRDAVGRYIRVYGKNNCDERHPLHYKAAEKAEKACMALLKLFDLYAPLKETEAVAQRSDAELTAYKKAQTLRFIAKITKRVYDKNEKEIRSITAQIEELSSGLERGLLDVDATASEQAVYVKKLLSRARRARSKVKAQWDLLDENGTYAFSSTTDTFADLQHFFPDTAIARLEDIEGFQRTISSVFKAELRAERSKLEKELAEYDKTIHEYETQLQELIQNPNLSKIVLTRHTELLREKDRMQKENDAYEKLQQLKEARDADAERLKTIKQQQLALISYRLNEEMSRLNDAIYEGSYNAPVLDFTDTGYNFFTPDDTGTGIAYKGLVVYDLAVLRLTRLPVLVHDSVVLKQISDDAIEKIIELYFTCGKQVIIALDKQDSYSEKTSRLLSESAVLRLTSNGQELFGRSWG